MARPNHAPEVRSALVDVAAVCAALGIERSKTERGKWRCPSHGGTSLSIRARRDGLQVRCFGCDLAGDVFTLIAAARGLDVARDFPKVLAEGARIGGLWGIVEELEGRRGVTRDAFPVQPPPPRPKVLEVEEPERTYPDPGEVLALWAASGLVVDDAEVRAMLEHRCIDTALVDLYGLARVLPNAPGMLPGWARFAGRSWVAAGYRLIVPTYDARGVMRSFRAWRVSPLAEGENAPKRVTPTGHLAAGLVFACPFALALLEAGRRVEGMREPIRVSIVEGDSDFLSLATEYSDADDTAPMVLGVAAGAWSAELAERIPDGARVIVATDDDAAGEKYAHAINNTLGRRCRVYRARATRVRTTEG